MKIAWLSHGAAAAERARQRIRRRGQTPKGTPLWTPEEDAIVRQLFPDYRRIIKTLKRRTYSAVRSRARTLGLVTKRHMWLGSEIKLLRKLYAQGATQEEIAAAFPDVTIEAIRHTALLHGIRRPRRPFKPTGISIIDQIRRRAFELNYSMTDVDALARSRRYFGKASWHQGHIDHNAIARAVRALDGDIAVQWKD